MREHLIVFKNKSELIIKTKRDNIYLQKRKTKMCVFKKNKLQYFGLFVIGFLLAHVTIIEIYAMSEVDKKNTYDEAELFFETGNFTQSLILYENILENDPLYSDAIAAKGAVFHRMGDYSTALDYYDKAILINSTNPFFLSDKGSALLAIGLDTDAENFLKRSLKILPNNIDALNGMANIQSFRKNYDQELIYRTSVLIIDPNNQEAYIGKGNAYVGLKDYEIAILQYNNALEINPHNIHAIIGIGNSLLELKNYDDALNQYDKVLSIQPENTNALRGKSITYVQMGNHELASKTYEKFETVKNKQSSIVTDIPIDTQKIPNWIKDTFGWFSEDKITEQEMINALKFLIEKNIIKIER